MVEIIDLTKSEPKKVLIEKICQTLQSKLEESENNDPNTKDFLSQIATHAVNHPSEKPVEAPNPMDFFFSPEFTNLQKFLANYSEIRSSGMEISLSDFLDGMVTE